MTANELPSSALPRARRRFRFEAVSARGERLSDTVVAAEQRTALKLLAARGLTPVALVDEGEVAPERQHGRIRAEDRSLVVRQLAGLIDGGVTLPEALAAVAAQCGNARAASELRAIVLALEAGEPIASALARAPRLLPELAREVIAAGASAGSLPAVLNRLADELESANALRGRVIGALLYPAIVGIVALGVIAVLMIFVLPQIVAAFGQTGQRLPALTRVLIALSEFVRDHGTVLAALLALAAGGSAFGFFSVSRMRRAAWLARLPVLGRVAGEAEQVRMLTTLALLVRAAVPLPQALAVGARVAATEATAARWLTARELLARGVGVTEALRDAEAVDGMTLELVRQGEAVGELARALEKAAELKRQTLAQRLARLATLVEPVMIVVLGAIVLLLVLAVMLPIVTLNTAVR
ncbi:MAG: type II secretion system F family protein [Casimicrobiaceae bacterium]|nr:type II secretion system F family protein [Casimicrobiaceae bacterium]